MNTQTAIQDFFRRLFSEPMRREDELAPPDPRWLAFEPAWLDHYLMHRDERAEATDRARR